MIEDRRIVNSGESSMSDEVVSSNSCGLMRDKRYGKR